jgi:uncharacterized protein
MSHSFLSGASHGKNQWWRYFVTAIAIVFGFLVLGSIATIVIFVLSSGLSAADLTDEPLVTAKLDRFIKSPSIVTYIAANMPSLFGTIGLLGGVYLFHRRKLTTLIRVGDRPRWGRMFAAAGFWFLMYASLSAIDLLLHPQNYTFSFSQTWLVFLPIALILTSIQTSFEELLFRGYILQGMGLKISNKLVLIITNGILFLLPHLGNPELGRGSIIALFYFIFGAFLAAISIADNGLELALGIHAANNLSIVLLFNTQDSALPSPSLWLQKEPTAPAIDILATLVVCGIFYYVFLGRRKVKE